MVRKKHDWNEKQDYYTVHHRALKKFQWRFLDHTTYQHTVFTDQYEALEIPSALLKTDAGNIVEIKIEKAVEIDPSGARKRARTLQYSYQAMLPSPDGRVLVRYDSPHKNHNQYHHKHIFDEHGNESQIQRIEDDEWPHVSEFLEEVIVNF
jgi:hypothetical protein